MQTDQQPSTNREVTTLAGGCFWCLEAVFEQIRGVESIVSGYAGGHVPNPTYQQVCTGTTGHTEVVQLTFDPVAVSYQSLLDLFFVIHDPTTQDRQGPDVGPQYRSAIFWHTDEQREAAEQALADLERAGGWPNPVVTELVPLVQFYAAEQYHQEYYRKNPGQGYCQVIIAPKVAKLRKEHIAVLKA
jgi:peptide-methionine (S)-S-oxide reductase